MGLVKKPALLLSVVFMTIPISSTRGCARGLLVRHVLIGETATLFASGPRHRPRPRPESVAPGTRRSATRPGLGFGVAAVGTHERDSLTSRASSRRELRTLLCRAHEPGVAMLGVHGIFAFTHPEVCGWSRASRRSSASRRGRSSSTVPAIGCNASRCFHAAVCVRNEPREAAGS